MDAEGTGTVVVGVDGSPESRSAPEFAYEEAARRGARLQVVAAAQLPEYWAMAYGLTVPPPIEDIVDSVRDAARQMVDDVVAVRSGPAVRIEVSVDARPGTAAHVLLDAADGADLLVLGHRQRGAVRSPAGLSYVLHARCPVTIVRPPKARQAVTEKAAVEHSVAVATA
jgi:nucleotide-binding universal stress UspA family protein